MPKQRAPLFIQKWRSVQLLRQTDHPAFVKACVCAYRESGLSVAGASRTLGVSRQAWYKWRKADKELDAKLLELEQRAAARVNV